MLESLILCNSNNKLFLNNLFNLVIKLSVCLFWLCKINSGLNSPPKKQNSPSVWPSISAILIPKSLFLFKYDNELKYIKFLYPISFFTKKDNCEIVFLNWTSIKFIDVPIIGWMLLFTHSWENSNTPNILLLSVIAKAGILFFLAKFTSFLIFKVLSDKEYEDRHLRWIKGLVILILNFYFLTRI